VTAQQDGANGIWNQLKLQKSRSLFFEREIGGMKWRSKWIRSANAGSELQVAAAFHGLGHGYFVGVFEVGADWDAHGDPRDVHA